MGKALLTAHLAPSASDAAQEAVRGGPSSSKDELASISSRETSVCSTQVGSGCREQSIALPRPTWRQPGGRSTPLGCKGVRCVRCGSATGYVQPCEGAVVDQRQHRHPLGGRSVEPRCTEQGCPCLCTLAHTRAHSCTRTSRLGQPLARPPGAQRDAAPVHAGGHAGTRALADAHPLAHACALRAGAPEPGSSPACGSRRVAASPQR